jgi:hypothetical protein
MKFPNVDIPALMEIIGATPNPEIATEIMCGIYVEPSVGQHTRVNHSSKGVCVFISYSKWDNMVTFMYEDKITKGGYFPDGTKVTDVPFETMEEMTCSSSTENCVYLHIPTGKVRKLTAAMTFEDWMKLEYSPTKYETEMLALVSV